MKTSSPDLSKADGIFKQTESEISVKSKARSGADEDRRIICILKRAGLQVSEKSKQRAKNLIMSGLDAEDVARYMKEICQRRREASLSRRVSCRFDKHVERYLQSMDSDLHVQIVENAADGACFFHALSQILSNQLSHLVLRNLAAHMYLQMDDPLEYIINSGLLSERTREGERVHEGIRKILGDFHYENVHATCEQKHQIRKLLFRVYNDRSTFVDEPQVIYMQKLLRNLGIIIVRKSGRHCSLMCTPILNVGDTVQHKRKRLMEYEQFALLLYEGEHYEAIMINGKLKTSRNVIPNILRNVCQ